MLDLYRIETKTGCLGVLVDEKSVVIDGAPGARIFFGHKLSDVEKQLSGKSPVITKIISGTKETSQTICRIIHKPTALYWKGGDVQYGRKPYVSGKFLDKHHRTPNDYDLFCFDRLSKKGKVWTEIRYAKSAIRNITDHLPVLQTELEIVPVIETILK